MSAASRWQVFFVSLSSFMRTDAQAHGFPSTLSPISVYPPVHSYSLSEHIQKFSNFSFFQKMKFKKQKRYNVYSAQKLCLD